MDRISVQRVLRCVSACVVLGAFGCSSDTEFHGSSGHWNVHEDAGTLPVQGDATPAADAGATDDATPANNDAADAASPRTPIGGEVVSTVSLHAVSAVARYANGHLRVLISDKANSCAESHAAGASMLDMDVAAAPLRLGAFSVVDPMLASPIEGQAAADVQSLSGSCTQLLARSSLSGAVHISNLSQGAVSGSIDVVVDGGHFVGDFDAPICDGADLAPIVDAACAH